MAKIPPVLLLRTASLTAQCEIRLNSTSAIGTIAFFFHFQSGRKEQFLLQPATSLGALAALWTPWPNVSPEPVPHRGSVEKLVLFTITLPGGSSLCLVVFGLMTGQQEGKDATQPTLFMLHFKFFLLFIVEVLMLT